MKTAMFSGKEKIMASINSIYGSSTNKGVGGLLSGLDTDDLVEKMTLGTRTKINRQYQSKQKLLYRQQAYREISSKLLAFSDKYLSFSSGSKTNIMSPSFFEAYMFKSSSNYVNVTGNAENIKNFSINSISQVASSARYTSEISGLKKSIDSDYAIKGEIFILEDELMEPGNAIIDKGTGKAVIGIDVALEKLENALFK